MIGADTNRKIDPADDRCDDHQKADQVEEVTQRKRNGAENNVAQALERPEYIIVVQRGQFKEMGKYELYHQHQQKQYGE